MSKVAEVMGSILAMDYLEDRREYSPEDLAHAYTLDAKEADALYELIQDAFPTPYRKGVKARRVGKPLSANPYNQDEWEGREWNLGWAVEDELIRSGS